MSLTWQSVVTGALAGFAATGPMTVLMMAGHRWLPGRQQYELPPATITGNVLRGGGLYGRWETAGPEVALPSHFAYGAAMGALYRGCMPREPTLAGGMAFGLGVWAVSYLGWLPATGLHRSARSEPLERNLLMIAAHLVWGASCTAILRQLQPEEPGAAKEDAFDQAPAVPR